MTELYQPSRSAFPVRAITLALVIFAVELFSIGVIFKHGIAFTCLDNWPPKACAGASGVLISVYCMAGALALLTLLSPGPIRHALALAGGASGRWR